MQGGEKTEKSEKTEKTESRPPCFAIRLQGVAAAASGDALPNTFCYRCPAPHGF